MIMSGCEELRHGGFLKRRKAVSSFDLGWLEAVRMRSGCFFKEVEGGQLI